ncbi:MAG: S49 family peptidase [Verrucomicrobiales bacterium]|nr:S49 family peptidase [Verrucomicrobiales bacterium]
MFQRLFNLLIREPLELRRSADGTGLGPEHTSFIEGLVRHCDARLKGAPLGLGDRQYLPRDFCPNVSMREGVNEARQRMGLDPMWSYDPSTNTATVNIHGPLAIHASLFEMDCMGMCSYDHVQAALQEIPVAHPRLAACILSISSPGGQVTGSAETAQMVADLADKLPVLAFTDDCCCSAALKIAAPATEFHAAPTADVGSIGTIIAFLDDSEYLAKLGVKWEVIASGDLKGTFYGPLSEAQRQHLVERVEANGRRFRGWMQAHRPGLTDADMRGQYWQAQDAPVALLDSTDLPTLDIARAYAARGMH